MQLAMRPQSADSPWFKACYQGKAAAQHMVQLIQTSKAGCDCHTVQSAPVSHKSPLPFDRQIGLWMSFCMARHALLGSHSSASVLPWYAGTRVHSQRLDAAPSNHWFVGKQAGIMAALAMTGLASYLDQLRLYPLQQGRLGPISSPQSFQVPADITAKTCYFPLSFALDNSNTLCLRLYSRRQLLQ